MCISTKQLLINLFRLLCFENLKILGDSTTAAIKRTVFVSYCIILFLYIHFFVNTVLHLIYIVFFSSGCFTFSIFFFSRRSGSKCLVFANNDGHLLAPHCSILHDSFSSPIISWIRFPCCSSAGKKEEITWTIRFMNEKKNDKYSIHV